MTRTLLAIPFLIAIISPVLAQSSWYNLPSPQELAKIEAEQKKFRENLPPDWGCYPLIDCANDQAAVAEKVREWERKRDALK